MAIVAIKGGCSVKKVAVGFQPQVAPGEYFLGGSFKYNAAGGGGPVVSDEKLSGSFRYNQSYPGCRECGNKFVYQCCHCGEFICYNGEETRGAVCPSCGQKSDVPKTKDDRIVRSGVSAGTCEIVLAMDASGSMSGGKIDEMKRAAINQFVSKFPTAKIAVVSFGCPNVATECGFTDNASAINAAINKLYACGGTPSPLPHIISDFGAFMSGANGSNRYVVLFTDGYVDGGESLNMPYADQIKAAGIKIITIGCTGADMNFLRKIASPGAMIETSAGRMESAFADAANKITQK